MQHRSAACIGRASSVQRAPAQRAAVRAAPQQQAPRSAQRSAPTVRAAQEHGTSGVSTSGASASSAPAPSRRASLGALAAAAAAAALALPPPPAAAEPAAAAPTASPSSSGASGAPDTTVTHTVFLEFGLAETAFKPAGERTLGDRSIVAEPTQSLGRLEIGLYGNACPATVANMLQLVRSGSLTGTVVSRISPGEYIQLARQGSRRQGEVEDVPGLQANSDLSSPAGFKLAHSRPGTVSLSISADNDEDPVVREKLGYKPLEFLITTGPGPVPRLDGINLVFGRVTQGLTTVAAVAAVPSFQPDARSQQLNSFAKFIGDDRADKVRRRYGRPLKAIVVTAAGVVGDAAGSGAVAGAAPFQQQIVSAL